MRNILFFCLLGLAVNVLASENHCNKPEEIAKWNGIIARHSEEPMYVKLFALRVGLCRAVEDGKIDLDTAIDVFDDERKNFGLVKEEDVLI